MLTVFGRQTGLPLHLQTCKHFARPRSSPVSIRTAATAAETPVKRGRGRPKKSETPAKTTKPKPAKQAEQKQVLSDSTTDMSATDLQPAQAKQSKTSPREEELKDFLGNDALSHNKDDVGHRVDIVDKDDLQVWIDWNEVGPVLHVFLQL